MAWSSAFLHGQVHFYYITGFCDKKFNFCKFAIFFADSISRAQELSNDVSFVIFGHKTWDLGISWFSSTPAGIRLTTNQFTVEFCLHFLSLLFKN